MKFFFLNPFTATAHRSCGCDNCMPIRSFWLDAGVWTAVELPGHGTIDMCWSESERGIWFGDDREHQPNFMRIDSWTPEVGIFVCTTLKKAKHAKHHLLNLRYAMFEILDVASGHGNAR